MGSPLDQDRVAAYRAAGLWDPDAEGARGMPQRLGLLDWLSERGVTLERMAATPEGDLISVGFDLVVEQGTMTAAELAVEAGIDRRELEELYRMLGVEFDASDAAVFEDGEVRLVGLLQALTATFPRQTANEILRAVDQTLSTLASAAISAFVGTLEVDLASAGDELEWARVVTSMGEVGLEMAECLRPLFRHHLRAGIGHQRAAMRRVDRRPLSELSVGFVDLVGYTSTTVEMEVEDLVDFTSRFRSRAQDVVSANGGRLVKHIGDEIMFSAIDAGPACTIGLDLLESFGEEGSRPRGGVAHGRLLARYGDLYGPIVNLASRLADAAVPGEVLAPADIEDHIAGHGGLMLAPAGRRQLKGFADPVEVVSVERSG